MITNHFILLLLTLLTFSTSLKFSFENTKALKKSLYLNSSPIKNIENFANLNLKSPDNKYRILSIFSPTILISSQNPFNLIKSLSFMINGFILDILRFNFYGD